MRKAPCYTAGAETRAGRAFGEDEGAQPLCYTFGERTALRKGSGVSVLEPYTLNMRSLATRVITGMFLAMAALSLTSCRGPLYRDPEFQFAGRPFPPSNLLQRVLVAYSNNGSTGGLQILDGMRDLRNNIQNTIPSFNISGFSASQPTTILSYPEQTRGYVLSSTDGTLTAINYSTEASSGSVASFGAFTASSAASVDGSRFAGAAQTAGLLVVTSGGVSYPLNLPNVYRVAINQGNSAILATVRNSNTLYRVVKLPASSNPVRPPGYIDCEPLLLPVYCVVPVAGTYDRPTNISFSLDGNSAYVLNCGPECGGTRSSISVLQSGALQVDNLPTVDPLSPSAPSPLASLPVANPVPIPGGVTAALSDGTNLYLSGQSLFSLNANGTLGTAPRADGLFTGYLSVMNLTTYAVSNPVSISDGTHTRMLFADDDTLWVGSSNCSTGERAARGLNYNCLTRVSLAGSTPTAQIFPNLTPGGSTTVPYPNTNQNQYYYGDLTGICWVQNYHKVYTAYGGQIHAFNTTDGSEINNTNITVQGVVLDVAYMDALTNSAN